VLQDVLGEVVSLLLPDVEAHGQRLHSERPDVPVLVQGDFQRLAQVLSNLLDSVPSSILPPAAISGCAWPYRGISPRSPSQTTARA